MDCIASKSCARAFSRLYRDRLSCIFYEATKRTCHKLQHIIVRFSSLLSHNPDAVALQKQSKDTWRTWLNYRFVFPGDYVHNISPLRASVSVSSFLFFLTPDHSDRPLRHSHSRDWVCVTADAKPYLDRGFPSRRLQPCLIDADAEAEREKGKEEEEEEEEEEEDGGKLGEAEEGTGWVLVSGEKGLSGWSGELRTNAWTGIVFVLAQAIDFVTPPVAHNRSCSISFFGRTKRCLRDSAFDDVTGECL